MRPIDADKVLEKYDAMHQGEPGHARKLIEEAATLAKPTLRQMVTWYEYVGEPIRIDVRRSDDGANIGFFNQSSLGLRQYLDWIVDRWTVDTGTPGRPKCAFIVWVSDRMVDEEVDDDEE